MFMLTKVVNFYDCRSVRECHNAIQNWRSAMARLWPWSWESEVFVKLMEDYGYLQVTGGIMYVTIVIWNWFQFAQSKGTQVRIRLIEKIFEDASFINADDPLRMPMTYTEVNSV